MQPASEVKEVLLAAIMDVKTEREQDKTFFLLWVALLAFNSSSSSIQQAVRSFSDQSNQLFFTSEEFTRQLGLRRTGEGQILIKGMRTSDGIVHRSDVKILANAKVVPAFTANKDAAKYYAQTDAALHTFG